MKIRTDIIRVYKDIHSWVGIVAGLALFIAFYAGAITMFEEPLQRWASPPLALAAPPSLERTPDLVAKVLAAHPEAAKGYDVNLVVDGNRPARVSWATGGRGSDEHAPRKTFNATLDANGALIVSEQQPSPVAQLIDVLHQQVGLPFPHEIAMPIMGAIALLYVIAIVSGTIVLLPSLVSDLFALRLGKNLKRMWLDVHNVLGLFSLPFHLIMALTAVVFAFHDQFYDAQGLAFGKGDQAAERRAMSGTGSNAPPLAPAQMIAALRTTAPGFQPVTLTYTRSKDGKTGVRVSGTDPRYAMRGPTFGFATVEPATGRLTGTDYMPGHQDGWSATATAFFALHFGNFGGTSVRWAYFLLGLAGALLFYTGNLLWIESRRKKERKAGLPEQTRATRILGALTVGVPLGCVAGISVTIAAAKALGADAQASDHSLIYYTVFLGFVGWALFRGAAQGAADLLAATFAAFLLVPLTTLIVARAHPPAVIAVDLTALAFAVATATLWLSTRKRAVDGPPDSVWASKRHATATT